MKTPFAFIFGVVVIVNTHSAFGDSGLNVRWGSIVVDSVNIANEPMDMWRTLKGIQDSIGEIDGKSKLEMMAYVNSDDGKKYLSERALLRKKATTKPWIILQESYSCDFKLSDYDFEHKMFGVDLNNAFHRYDEIVISKYPDVKQTMESLSHPKGYGIRIDESKALDVEKSKCLLLISRAKFDPKCNSCLADSVYLLSVHNDPDSVVGIFPIVERTKTKGASGVTVKAPPKFKNK